MTANLKVLLIGASGNWGTPLTQEFIKQKSSFDRIAVLARDEQHATKFYGLRDQGIDIVVGSFLDAKSYSGFTVVLCLVGNDLLRLQPAMIEAAVAAGVMHFYPSEWGSDTDQPEMAHVRYYRDKMVTRSHLHSVAKQHAGFKYTLFIIGMFTEYVFWEGVGWDHDKRTAVVYGAPEYRVGGSSIADVAKWTVQSLIIPFKQSKFDKEFPGRRSIRVQSGSKPYGQLVADLDAARGGRKYEVEYRDSAEALNNQEIARMCGDEAEEMSWSIRQLPASGYVVADGLELGYLDNDLFDIEPESQAETLKRIWKDQ